MEVREYEDWMKPQVAELFSSQYGESESKFAGHIEEFYDHSFQRDRCLRFVAMEGEKIIGFQGLFYWPYNFKGKTYNSFQAGDSLVHQEFRGRGVFQNLLNYADMHTARSGIEFLISFPGRRAINSYVRNQWKLILDLQWHVKVINPFWLLFRVDSEKLRTVFNSSISAIGESPSSFRLARSPEFLNWREHYSTRNTYASHCYLRNDWAATFNLKLSKRKGYINELVIGDFQCNSDDAEFVYE